MKSRRSLLLVRTIPLAACLLLPVESALGQQGGFSPERIFGYWDQDKDGQLTSGEMERLPPSLQSWLQQNNYSEGRPLSREDFVREAPQMFESMRRAREEQSESRDRDDDHNGPDENEDRGRSFSGFGGGGPASGGFGGFSGGPFGGSSSGFSSLSLSRSAGGGTSGAAASKSRFQFLHQLPEQWQLLDSDGDQQIGLYEWDRSTRGDFLRMDRNGDGFLTPLELKQPTSSTAAASSISTTASATGGAVPVAGQAGSSVSFSRAAAVPVQPASGQPVATAASSMTAASAGAASLGNSSASISTLDPKKARTAEYFFKLMDRNRDGQVTEDEWARSRRVGPKFREAGHDLSSAMPQETFVAEYVRLFLDQD